MRAFLYLGLCLLCLPVCAQTRDADGFTRVETREQVERAPQDTRRVRANTLPNADMGALARFTNLQQLDLRCHTSLNDSGLEALHKLPAGTVVDVTGCLGMSASAISALQGNDASRRGWPLMNVKWNPATLADGRMLGVNGSICDLSIGTDQGTHKRQRFECYSADPALGGVFTGVVEVTEPGKATSKAAVLYAARGQQVKPDNVLVNRIWRSGRYLNYVTAGEFDDEHGFLMLREILDAMEILGARRQAREYTIPFSTELVIGGANLLGDEAYRAYRNDAHFAFVNERGLRLYLDPAPSIHNLDPQGVAHLADATALRRCLAGLDGVHIDLLDAAGAEILAGWRLVHLVAESLAGMNEPVLGKLIKSGQWRVFSLTGACNVEGDVFEGITFGYAVDMFRLDGRKGADGKWQGPPITAGLLKGLYTTTEEDRAFARNMSFRGNPNLTSDTLKHLPTWWEIESLDASECTGLSDEAVRQLLQPSKDDGVMGMARRITKTLNLSGNPQLTDAAFEFAPSEDFDLDRMSLNLSGCLGLTDAALQRLAKAGAGRVTVSRKDRFTEAGIKALASGMRVLFIEDGAAPGQEGSEIDDTAAPPAQKVYVVRDTASLQALPKAAGRVRFEGNDADVLAKLWSRPGLVELDLSGNEKLAALPEAEWNMDLRRLDLRGCMGLHTSELAPLACLHTVLENADFHLSVDAAHVFAPLAELNDAKMAEARSYVAAWRAMVQAELDVRNSRDADSDAQEAAHEKLVTAEEAWRKVSESAFFDAPLSRAIMVELDAATGPMLEAFKAAGIKSTAEPASQKADAERADALSGLFKLREVVALLNGNALLFDTKFAGMIARFDKAIADYATQLTTLEKEYESATGDAATELHRQINCVKDLARELESARLSPTGQSQDEFHAALRGLANLRSLRVEKALHWRRPELAAVVERVPCRLELDLSGNTHLTDADIEVLFAARRLAWVNLKGCKGISDAAIKRLADLRPGTKIER